MKKLFIVLAAAGFLTACNNTADTTDNAKDSLDSIENAKKEAIDSSSKEQKQQIDSTTDAKKEALDRKDSANRKDTLRK